MNLKIELNKENKILLICLLVSLFLLSLGILTYDPGVLGNAIIISVFIILLPQLVMRYEKYRLVKDMEDKFPLFLRDMTDSIRSGMPFHKSLVMVSKIDYGKLSKEVKKASNQVSWGMPFDKAIGQFADRVKASKRLSTALRTIRELHLSGGDVVSTLESVAESCILLEDSEKERKSLLNQYVVLMYAICFIFLGIVAAINKLMIPIFQVTSMPAAGEVLGLVNPCDICMGFDCSVCSIFQMACHAFFIDAENIACYYTSLFFFMSIVVSISCGLVAGQISENSIIAGIKHSLILSVITFGAFSILIRIGLMGV